MILDLLTPEDFAAHLKAQGVTRAKYAQETLTSGKEVAFRTVKFVASAPLWSEEAGHHVVRFERDLWRGPAAFEEDHVDEINQRADRLKAAIAGAGVTLEPGLWRPS